jgi:Icc-related predicted phosphoesterase
MRFLVLSDIHMRNKVIGWANKLVKVHDADALMVLGDITQFGPPEWAGEFFSKFEVPAYAVHGNCDPPLVLDWIERTAVSLHKNKIQLEGETLIGLGGSNPTIFDTPNEQSEVEIYESLLPNMETRAIMVTHCPPYGINDMTRHGHHAGSHSLLRISREFTPKAWLAGHIHEARGIVEVEGSRFMNPGAAKDGFSGIMELGESIRMELLDRVD